MDIYIKVRSKVSHTSKRLSVLRYSLKLQEGTNSKEGVCVRVRTRAHLRL